MKAKRTQESASRDWVVAALAAAGFAISAYLAATKLAGGAVPFCEAGGGCDVVQSSRYATFLGLPTSAWGVGLYAVVAVLALAGLTVQRWVLVFVLAVGAASFSAYLTYLQLVVLRAICPYCLADAGVAFALLAAAVLRRPAARGRRSPTRPRRLAVVGGLVAIATIVFAVGVFVGGSPTESLAYQEALARHLSASGAIFYGAYW